MSSNARVRVAMIGLGSIAAKVYLPELTQRPGVEVVGLSSRRDETVQRYGDLYPIEQRFTSTEDLLALHPDIVFIHASTVDHFELIEKCLKSGVHVFVDKPLTDDKDRLVFSGGTPTSGACIARFRCTGKPGRTSNDCRCTEVARRRKW